MTRKSLIACVCILLSVISILLLNNLSVILTTVLIVLSYLKHTILPVRKEVLFFALISSGGALAEILLVNLGGAWAYASPDVLGIPLYMPVFWSLVGSCIITVYEEFAGTHS